MENKATIILEGGANRGVFTSGVLDFLMDKDFYMSNIIGVSAGSCNGVNYASHQRSRSKNCFIIDKVENRWIYKNRFFSRKGLLDMNMLFNIFAEKTFPYNYDALYENNHGCEIVATDCITGKTEYFDFQKLKRTMDYCRASCSMPFVTPLVFIDGVPYLDGSVSNSVPLDRAKEIGNEKIVIILTRLKNYRKSENNNVLTRFIKKKYRKYPNLVNAQLNRPSEYNNRLEELDRLEKEGKIFIIRPEVTPVARLETDVEKLTFFYNHGYSLMEKRFEELKKYLNS